MARDSGGGQSRLPFVQVLGAVSFPITHPSNDWSYNSQTCNRDRRRRIFAFCPLFWLPAPGIACCIGCSSTVLVGACDLDGNCRWCSSLARQPSNTSHHGRARPQAGPALRRAEGIRAVSSPCLRTAARASPANPPQDSRANRLPKDLHLCPMRPVGLRLVQASVL